jgi:hypothetical protein
MTFRQRSVLAMTAILVLLFGWYFAIVLGQLASNPASEIDYTGLMIPVAILLVVLAVVAHAVLAIGAPAKAGGYDERDRFVALRGHRIARYVLAGLVVAEITEGLTRLVSHRRAV